MTAAVPGLAVPARRELLGALDLTSLRLVLSGESVIDWPRLEFGSDQEIERFLRLQEFEVAMSRDRAHIALLHQEALTYLSDVLRYRIPSEIRKASDVRKLLRFASQKVGLKRNRVYACMTLKVMHILHHLLARELLFHAPLSEAQLSELLAKKVFDGIDQMRAAGIPVVEYTGGRKTRHSLVTKLLAKRETIASQIFDKSRFRIVVKNDEDLVSALAFMSQQLFPFNYVIPGQSDNGLVDLKTIAARYPTKKARRHLLSDGRGVLQNQNEFSGKTYRAVNFVVDMPLRITSHLQGLKPPMDPRLGDIVFVLAEFQLVDQKTAENNQEGDNSHSRYKSRQEQRVRVRLEAGGRQTQKRTPAKD